MVSGCPSADEHERLRTISMVETSSMKIAPLLRRRRGLEAVAQRSTTPGPNFRGLFLGPWTSERGQKKKTSDPGSRASGTLLGKSDQFRLSHPAPQGSKIVANAGENLSLIHA